jgi:hypothetical protein
MKSGTGVHQQQVRSPHLRYQRYLRPAVDVAYLPPACQLHGPNAADHHQAGVEVLKLFSTMTAWLK